ncbi:MAG: cell division protein FtsH, partial [Deltaproteobacteria bacterium]|nr:cell division protein FtsH [Deltaproteobacteria bacterium]
MGLIVAVLALANLFNSSQQTEPVSYARFIQQLPTLKTDHPSMKTLNVEVHPTHVSMSYKLTDDGSTYEVTGPVTEELYKKLESFGIDYKVEPEEDSSLLQFAIMWLPMILIVIIMVMFMRQMQAGGG